MRKIIAGLVALTAIVGLSACSSQGSSTNTVKSEQKKQTAITQQLEQNQPIPQLKYSQLRQNLIEIKTAEAKGVQTTTFFFQMGDQNPVFSCPSIGAPIDAGDQLTNPNQIVHDGYPNGGAALTIDQMDPTGEYSTGNGSAGTYSVCLDGSGNEFAQYWEGQVMTVFAPAVWDPAAAAAGKSGIKLVGKPTFDFSGNH